MNYIVLDMEWNQPAFGDAVLCKNGICMKNEIIQIGAVKLDEDGNRLCSFSRIIKPASLTSMNKTVKQLTGITDEMLGKGDSFENVIKEFREWCGEEWVLLIWGYDDVRILRHNLKFYGIDDSWVPPHYNVQLIFCNRKGLEKRQYALSYALEYFSIPADDKRMHDALYDAECTAKVCSQLDLKNGIDNIKYMPSSELCGKNGEDNNPVIVKRKFRHLKSRDDIWANGFITRPACPFCGEKMKNEKPKYYGKTRVHITGRCEKDGDFITVLKISETPEKDFSVSQQMYVLDEKTLDYFSRVKTRKPHGYHSRTYSKRGALRKGAANR